MESIFLEIFKNIQTAIKLNYEKLNLIVSIHFFGYENRNVCIYTFPLAFHKIFFAPNICFLLSSFDSSDYLSCKII